MKILYFSQFYEPESIAPSFRATENARIWVNDDNDVTVFTGYPNYPTGKIFEGYNPKLLTEEMIAGVRVLRSKLVAKPNTSIVKRLQNALSYFFFGWFNLTFNAKRIKTDYDVVLGTSGIIFNALLAWIFAVRHHIPFVFELRDITYVQMQAIGKNKSSIVVRGMKWLELLLCRKATKVVVVTNGFKNILIEEGISSEKIAVITNGVDVENAKGPYDTGKKFVLSYFGTLGISQNIVETFGLAKVISEEVDDFKYLIIGEGAQKAEIESAASKEKFIEMQPGMSASDLEPYYSNTQLSVITLKKSENFKYTIPSKLFQIMGRGIAVLFIGPNGESTEIIRKYNAGIALTGTTEENKALLKDFFSSANWNEKLKEMGENGRRAVERNYCRTKLANDYLYILKAAKDIKNV